MEPDEATRRWTPGTLALRPQARGSDPHRRTTTRTRHGDVRRAAAANCAPAWGSEGEADLYRSRERSYRGGRRIAWRRGGRGRRRDRAAPAGALGRRRAHI